jgi:Spy/CpxP family protein refolding chaperone
MTATAADSPSKTTPTRRRLWRLCIGATLAGVLGLVASGCLRGKGHHSWHRGGHGLANVTTPEDAEARAQSAAKWMVRKLDATDAQQRRIEGIVDESIQQLLPLHEQHRLHHTQLLDALSGSTVDRAEIERLRQLEIGIADAASRQLLDATMGLFEVLTADQRSRFLDHLHERHL